MNLTIGNQVFQKNVGIIAKPSNYEFHWLCEFKNGTKLEMFDNSGLATNKRSFQEVSKQPSNVSYVVWKSLNNDFHFGVNFNNRVPTFMIANQLMMPADPRFYNGIDFTPDFFIRNSISLSAGLTLYPVPEYKEMIYFAGYTFKNNDKLIGMYLSFNGKTLVYEGFTSFEICGGYKLR